jgi:hypothetical protein
VSALAHYIEGEGVATAAISLVREHTEKIRPPRALWVPFDLGRPLGVPNDKAFQADVLRALLALVSRKSGPVLEDYPRDAPGQGLDEMAEWSCPLPLPPLAMSDDPVERRRQLLMSELALLTPWYAESARRRGRTTFGLSGLGPESAPEIVAFLARMAEGEAPPLPSGVHEAMPTALRSMADDIKAYYLEAAAAQPGADAPGAHRLNTWLYHETRLGEALYDIRDRLAAEAALEAERGTPRPPPALVPNRYRDRPH